MGGQSVFNNSCLSPWIKQHSGDQHHCGDSQWHRHSRHRCRPVDSRAGVLDPLPQLMWRRHPAHMRRQHSFQLWLIHRCLLALASATIFAPKTYAPDSTGTPRFPPNNQESRRSLRMPAPPCIATLQQFAVRAATLRRSAGRLVRTPRVITGGEHSVPAL